MGAEREEKHIVSSPNGKSKGNGKHAETHHLNPVSIRVQNESNILQLSIGEALFKWHAQPLEACASGLNVVHGDRDVAESARLGIARMVGRLVERLRAGIVGKL